MRDKHETNMKCGCAGRRTFLSMTASAATLTVVGGGLLARQAYADVLTKEQRAEMTPDEILMNMKLGNERFRTGQNAMRNYLKEQRASAKEQHPMAVVLSCIDSRAPAEVIMDLGIGDIFNARVAGNIINEDMLGSMEFACKVAGSKVVLVMGHTACGAIKGAIDNVQLGNLTGLIAKIRPAVKATSYKGDLSTRNSAYVNAVARTNVELTMADIRKKSAILHELELNAAIKIAGGMYNLETATLDLFA